MYIFDPVNASDKTTGQRFPTFAFLTFWAGQDASSFCFFFFRNLFKFFKDLFVFLERRRDKEKDS